jgi:hypothetical protein
MTDPVFTKAAVLGWGSEQVINDLLNRYVHFRHSRNMA